MYIVGTTKAASVSTRNLCSSCNQWQLCTDCCDMLYDHLTTTVYLAAAQSIASIRHDADRCMRVQATADGGQPAAQTPGREGHQARIRMQFGQPRRLWRADKTHLMFQVLFC